MIADLQTANNAQANTKVIFNNCYARVNLVSTSGYDAGGLAGIYYGSGSVTNCYWSGTSNATHRTGSLIPWVHVNNNSNQNTLSTIKVQNSYYDKQKFPLSICATNSGKGLTTEQMKTQSSYVGWDFEKTWYMGEDGYPELKF